MAKTTAQSKPPVFSITGTRLPLEELDSFVLDLKHRLKDFHGVVYADNLAMRGLYVQITSSLRKPPNPDGRPNSLTIATTSGLVTVVDCV